MKMESMDELFEKPLHEEVNCPWYTEDYFGHSHPCTECENNEMLQQDMEDEADSLIESGEVGTKNTETLSEVQGVWIEAMNIVIRRRKEEAGL